MLTAQTQPWHSAPFLRPALSLGFGIVLGSEFPTLMGSPWGYASAAGLIGLLVFIMARRKLESRHIKIQASALLLAFALLGIGLMRPANPCERFSLPNGSGHFLIAFSPEKVDTALRGKANVIACWNNQWEPLQAEGQVWLVENSKSPKTKLDPNSLLLVDGTVESIRPQTLPDAHAFSDYLIQSHITHYLYVQENVIHIVGTRELDACTSMRLKTRRYIEEQAALNFADTPCKSLFLTMLFGFKDNQTASISSDFRATGTLHLLAVSGLHVTILFASIMLLVQRFKGRWSKWVACALSLLLIWYYTFITGCGTSILRSAIMVSFSAVGLTLSKRSGLTNSLSLAAIIMLAIHPEDLFDIGFQLSFSALAGMGLFSKPMAAFFYAKHPIAQHMYQLIASTIGAQLGTLPVILYHFHTIPIYFLPANLMLIPVCTLITYLGFVWIATSWIPMLGALVSTFISWLTLGCQFIAHEIGHWPAALSEGWWFMPEHLLLMVVALLMAGVGLKMNNKWTMRAGWAGLVGLFLGWLVFDHLRSKQVQRFYFEENGIFVSETLYNHKAWLHFHHGKRCEFEERRITRALDSHWKKYAIAEVSIINCPTNYVTSNP